MHFYTRSPHDRSHEPSSPKRQTPNMCTRAWTKFTRCDCTIYRQVNTSECNAYRPIQLSCPATNDRVKEEDGICPKCIRRLRMSIASLVYRIRECGPEYSSCVETTISSGDSTLAAASLYSFGSEAESDTTSTEQMHLISEKQSLEPIVEVSGEESERTIRPERERYTVNASWKMMELDAARARDTIAPY